MALTKLMIDRASYQGDGSSWDVRYDTGKLPGFGVRIYPTGVKSFVVRYRTRSGRLRLHTIGRFGVLTLEQGRDRARKILADVADGKDPLAERKSARAAVTMKDFADVYMERWAKIEKRTWAEDQRRIDSHVVPAFGRRKLAEVKRADVAALHAKVAERGKYEANRVLALMSVMFTKAQEWGYLPDDAKNPARGVEPYTEKSRDRWVRPTELPALAKAIGAEPNIYIRAALWMMLLTGCRKSELLRAKWSHVDFDRRELRVPETKSGEPHVVPLSLEAVTLLRELPRTQGNPYIFPGHKRGTHVQWIAKNWRAVREAAGCEDVRLHDLRRTVGSWLAASGASLQLIGSVLNHHDIATTQVYARLTEDAGRRALDEHGRRLMEVANGAAKVAP